jgi:hypothetical protein
MAERKPQWPRTGDLTIAIDATDYGAYANKIDKRGILHATIISSYNINKAGSLVGKINHGLATTQMRQL